MIRQAINYFRDLPAVFIDGTLYVGLSWFVYSQTFFGNDEAAKFLSPAMRFWINYSVGSLAIMAGSLKMFRSSAYADHQKAKADKEKTGNTDFITKPGV